MKAERLTQTGGQSLKPDFIKKRLFGGEKLFTNPARAFYYKLVQLKLCPKCKRPFMARHEFCPHCAPAPEEWDQDGWMNFGCLIATILPLFLFIIFWLFLFLGMFF